MGFNSQGSRWLAIIGAAALIAAVPGAVVAQDDYVPERVSGIPGALLPDELSLWIYDSEAAAYAPVEGDATAPYVPSRR